MLLYLHIAILSVMGACVRSINKHDSSGTGDDFGEGFGRLNRAAPDHARPAPSLSYPASAASGEVTEHATVQQRANPLRSQQQQPPTAARPELRESLGAVNLFFSSFSPRPLLPSVNHLPVPCNASSRRKLPLTPLKPPHSLDHSYHCNHGNHNDPFSVA